MVAFAIDMMNSKRYSSPNTPQLALKGDQMKEAVFNQTVTVNKSNTASVFAIEDQLHPKALVTFTAGFSAFNVHLTPAEAVELATVLNDAADWIQSEAGRKAAREEQARRDSVAAGERPQFDKQVPDWMAA